MATWLNHVTISGPRNGTATHTVTPSTGTVAAGALFTPTAGRFLVVLVEGAVTSSTPAGWTQPPNGSALSNTGLYLWYRIAAGADAFTTNHNGANYPVVFDIYEFPNGTTFVAAVSEIGTSGAGGAGPTLTGLTGSKWVAGVVGASAGASSSAGSVTWSAGVSVVSAGILTDVTDGYTYGLTYLEDFTNTSASAAATVLPTPGATVERLMFALAVAPSGSAVVTASVATATATAPVPNVLRTGDITVTAATGTASASAPSFAAITSLSGGGPATATALVRPPTTTTGAAAISVAARITARFRAPLVTTRAPVPTTGSGDGSGSGAWGIPGWTAQNFAYPPDGAPVGAPALPVVTAFGRFRDGQGRNLESRVVAIPSEKVIRQNGYQYYLDTQNVEAIRGEVFLQLPVGSWTWTIRQRIGPKTFVNVGVNPTGDFDLSALSQDVEVDGGGPDATYTVLDGGAI